MNTKRGTTSWVIGLASLASCLALAACGSQLTPQQVADTTISRPASAVGNNVPASTSETTAPGTGAPSGAVGPGDPVAPVVPGSTSTDPVAPGAPQPSSPVSTPAGATKSNSPTGDTKSASCDGFQNGPGITDDTINIGNSSDISGPVPGLFQSSQQAVEAYVAYFNASGDTICGRKLHLDTYDSRTDAGADQQAYTTGCQKDFAMVGSMSGFDSGGAASAQGCGIPDIRAISTTTARSSCTTCYAAQPAGPTEFENAVPDFIKKYYGGGQHAAMLYLDAGAAAENAPSQVALETKRGMHFDYVSGIGLTEFNYAPYVQAMKDAHIETVQFVGANPEFVRLAQAMQQASFTPKVFMLDPTAYSPDYTSAAGSAAAAVNTVVFTNFTPFEEASSNPELKLYLAYLQQVSPGATPDFFGVFAWSAARLFVQQATALGGKLTRASLVASMKSVKDWTANGLHSPQPVGTKRQGDCWRFLTWSGSAWQPDQGTKYQCDGTTTH